MSTAKMKAELRAIIANTEKEMATTEQWRSMMRRARKSHGRDGMTQTHLAELLDVSQTVISDIETGAQMQSKLIPAIARALEIPPPFLEVQGEFDALWHEAGRALEKRDRELFLAQLRTVQLQAQTKK